MSTVGRQGEHVVLILSEEEGELLHSMIAQYLYLIGDQHGLPPPARLFPAASADPEVANAFAAASREDLVARKIENAEMVSVAVDLDPPLLLGAAVVERWLATLTDLRLILADRLEIRSDDDPVPDTDVGLVYEWLGMLQELLIAALEDRL